MVALVLAVVAGTVVVPFFIGLVKGPAATPVRHDPDGARLLTPLPWVTRVCGLFFLLYVLLAALEAKDGFFGGSTRGAACVNTGFGGSSFTGSGWKVRPGGSLTVADSQGCVLHPGAGDWAMLLLTKLPSLLLWGCMLLMIFRLVRRAARNGPFNRRTASIMTQLGWLILLGAALVGALDTLGTSVLVDAVLRPQPYDAASMASGVLFGALHSLFPVPALAGAALISFGRITRVGAVMDEELKATV